MRTAAPVTPGRPHRLAAISMALALAACSAPGGRYPVTLSHNGNGERAWTLDRLPFRSRIVFSGLLLEPGKPGQAARFTLSFRQSGVAVALLEVGLEDPRCNGSYAIHVDRLEAAGRIETSYLTPTLPWGQPLRIRAEWVGFHTVEVEIDGAGRQTVSLAGSIDEVDVSLSAGDIADGVVEATAVSTPTEPSPEKAP
jgi:hypothetical protein